MNLKTSIQKRIRESIYNTFPFDDLVKDEKYISIYTSKAPLPNGHMFEFNYYKDYKHHILPNNTSKILSLIKEFKSLYEHAADIENYKLANFHQALKILQELERKNLLIGQRDFLCKLENSKPTYPVPDIDTLCWNTRDRNESVKKSIESFIKNINGAKKYDFIVFDDSCIENYNKNKQNINLLNRKYETHIKIIGRNERKLFLNRICEILKNEVPKHVIEYGLMGLKGIDHRTGMAT